MFVDEKSRSAFQIAERAILQGKTWRYLRYLHFRDYLERVSSQIDTVCICGTGYGLAEFLLAIEFPQIKFTLTDIVDRKHGYPNYFQTMQLCWEYEVDNVDFFVWNVLNPTTRRFDLVASTEMLEHIENDELAAKNMRLASNRFVYCLVPYADKATNKDPQRRKRVWEKFEHYVCGYDPEDLEHLFPNPVFMSGAYWHDHGLQWRLGMKDMEASEITNKSSDLIIEAKNDLINDLPKSGSDCLGIKVLASC